MNKSAKTSGLVIAIIVGVALYFAYTGGVFDSLFVSNAPVDDLYPSDLTTTITLNTGDALATTAVGANVSYYVFDANGRYLKEGTTSSGTASFTVPTGGNNYKVLLYYDAGTTDYLPTEVTFSTDGADPTGRAVQTINVDLLKESAATISKVRDPVDLNSNLTSTAAGSTVPFDLLIKASTSNAALYKPFIRAMGNKTSIEKVNFPGLTEITCPDRLPTGATQKTTCFQIDKIIKSSDGIQTYSGNLKIDSANAPGSTEVMNFTIADTGIYKDADYKTKGYSAFKYGAENPVNDADIGAADSSTGELGFGS